MSPWTILYVALLPSISRSWPGVEWGGVGSTGQLQAGSLPLSPAPGLDPSSPRQHQGRKWTDLAASKAHADISVCRKRHCTCLPPEQPCGHLCCHQCHLLALCFTLCFRAHTLSFCHCYASFLHHAPENLHYFVCLFYALRFFNMVFSSLPHSSVSSLVLDGLSLVTVLFPAFARCLVCSSQAISFAESWMNSSIWLKHAIAICCLSGSWLKFCLFVCLILLNCCKSTSHEMHLPS